MVPLDNLQQIQKLLHHGDNIDGVIDGLQTVQEYQLFEADKNIEPLRLFRYRSDSSDAAQAHETPTFTQKEHHASSMDGFFNAPMVQGEGKEQRRTATAARAAPQGFGHRSHETLALTEDILDLIPNPNSIRKPL